jgi:hypothetical protein
MFEQWKEKALHEYVFKNTQLEHRVSKTKAASVLWFGGGET